MSVTNESTEEVTTEENVVDLDNQVDNSDTSTQEPESPAAAEPDWRAFYAQSVRERQSNETELQNLRNQLAQQPKAPMQQEEDITDADIERYGTTGVIKKIVGQTLRAELSNSLGDISEISRDFKRGKQLDQSENSFFNQYPHLQPYREALGSTIRGQLQNAQNVDPNAYQTQAFATIGYYTAMNAANQQQQQPMNSVTPPRQNIPPNRTAGTPAPARSAVKLAEIERVGMRKMGMDPNKKEDVDEFLAMVNNDGGITL